jgi:sodium transport system permease protein
MNYYIKRQEQQAKVEHFKVGIREDVAIDGLRPALTRVGLEVMTVRQARQAVETKEVTYGIEVTGSAAKPQLFFYSDNSEMTSSMARSRVDEALDALWRQRVTAELTKRNVPISVVQPFQRASVNVAKPRKMTGAFIGRLIGFLLLIFLFNGAMYSAVDCTAGEKERKTMEILLASAAGRTEIVTAKVLTAMVTSFGTTLLSVSSYAFAFSRTTNKSGAPTFAFPTDPLTISLLVVLILPVAIMAASISVAAATPAKSTREAMSYLTPGLFIIMFLGMLTFIIDKPPSVLMSLIPFANFSQMLREVLSGDWTPLRYFTTLAANLVYSVIAIAVAVRSFTNEKVLFRS